MHEFQNNTVCRVPRCIRYIFAFSVCNPVLIETFGYKLVILSILSILLEYLGFIKISPSCG